MNTRITYIGNGLSVAIAPPIPPNTPENSIYGATKNDILYLREHGLYIKPYSSYQTHRRSNGTWIYAQVYEFISEDYDRIVELLIARYPNRRVKHSQFL
jgi:hypothetical protein